MKTVLAILLCVLVLLQVRLWAGAGSMADIARLENAIEAQNEENAGLEARNAVLLDDITDLRNGLDSIEERARNELGLIRQGETFYLIVEEDPNAREAPSEPTQVIRPEPLPEAPAPELPPEIAEDENPYLEIFRDDEDAAAQADAESPPAAGTGLQ